MLKDSIQEIIDFYYFYYYCDCGKLDCYADFTNINDISDFARKLLKDSAWLKMRLYKRC